MAANWFEASAPGKLMLLGEHAVLRGALALVCAVDQRMYVRITPVADDLVEIQSALGQYRSRLPELAPHDGFRFVLGVLQHLQPHLPAGCTIQIRSDFSHQVGLGSSAAVTAALMAALHAWLGRPLDKAMLFEQSLAVIRRIQGTGSGADLAASVYGGILGYRMQPLEIYPFACTHPITVVYSGKKSPTVEVIRRVDDLRERHAQVFATLFAAMDRIGRDARETLAAQDWPAFGELLNINQGLMEALSVSDRDLAYIVHTLRQDPGIQGAKISGSGLGDCVLGWGRIHKAATLQALSTPPYAVLPLGISAEGIRTQESSK